MTFKKCKNDGCEIQIEVRNTAEGWRPFEESGNKHNCQYSDYAKKQRAEQKNDHGNESFTSIPVAGQKANGDKFVDHTAKGQSKLKLFFGLPSDVENDYNNFLATNGNKIKTQGAQFQMTKDDEGEAIMFAIALYYEEVIKQ